MGFVIEEAGAAVFFGEAFEGAVFVLLCAGVNVAGDADVECAGVTAHDVGVARHFWGSSLVVWLSIKCWGFVVERFGRFWWFERCRGPSTSLRSAQDDGFFCVRGK